ncbi:MAG: putative F420-dependent oxidoreductase, Rv3093c family [Frankiales bacterium]|nr:putative F420-dependent oxidoreductase, Rv3093c family [Frankiales bacterium]
MPTLPLRRGVTLGIQHGLRVEQLPALALAAEGLGYTDVWSEEAGGTDAVSTLTAAAMVTRSTAVGTGIIPVFGRAPAVVAMEAACLQLLSGGRFRLGLGASTATIATAWRGEPYRRPLTRLLEYVDVIRRLLAGEKVTHRGEFDLDGFRLQLPAPLPAPPPIYLAALGDRTLTAVGEHADGVILNNLTPGAIARSRALVADAAARCGRDPSAIDIIGRVSVLVEEDEERCREVVSRIAGFYLSAEVYRASLTRQGFGAEVERFSARWDKGERVQALGELSDDLLAAFAVFGDRDTVRAQIGRLRAAGLDAPIIYPIVLPGADQSRDDALAKSLDVLAVCGDV